MQSACVLPKPKNKKTVPVSPKEGRSYRGLLPSLLFSLFNVSEKKNSLNIALTVPFKFATRDIIHDSSVDSGIYCK
jgi:hypothetical protein